MLSMLWLTGLPMLYRLGPMSEIHPKTLWDRAYNRGGVKLPKAVLNTLRTWADPHTLECFASLDDLAEQTGLSASACWRQIKTNEAAGWIEVLHEGHSGGKANDYRLLNPSVNAMNPGVNAKETLALTHNQLGIKEIPKGISKGEENPSENARDDQDLHSAEISPRVGPPRVQGDPQGSPIPSSEHTEPRRGEVKGDYNPSVNARVPVASTQASIEVQAPAWDVTEHFTPWPGDKPLPSPPDPFTTYVDEVTGEPISTA